jgi:hypothetical protein
MGNLHSRFDDHFGGHFAENGVWHVLQGTCVSGMLATIVFHNFT